MIRYRCPVQKISGAFVASALLLVPFLASAATGDVLKTLKSLDTELRIDAEDSAIIQEERALEENEELFPSTGESRSSAGSIDELREERTGDFVVIRADNRDIPLRDVPRSAWFAPYVRDVADRGLVSGYRDADGVLTGLYGPGDNVTVEQLSKLVVLARAINVSECPLAKNLTASGSWSLSYVGCAEQNGWALYGDGTVDVHRNATRAEVLVTMLQAFEVPYPEAMIESFSDVPPTMQFSGYIARAKADGVVAGYTDDAGMPTGMFGPTDPVTRAETAKIVSLVLQVYAQ